jgi:hypothetical protein
MKTIAMVQKVNHKTEHCHEISSVTNPLLHTKPDNQTECEAFAEVSNSAVCAGIGVQRSISLHHAS